MASRILDRFGLGNERAVANARRDALRRADEDRLVADLIEALARHDVVARLPVAQHAPEPSRRQRAAA